MSFPNLFGSGNSKAAAPAAPAQAPTNLPNYDAPSFQKPFDYSQTYFKLIRKDMNHRGQIYKLGANHLTSEFINDSNNMLGGLYFYNQFGLNYGLTGVASEEDPYIAFIRVPASSKVVDMGQGRWKTDMFVIENLVPFRKYLTDHINLQIGVQTPLNQPTIRYDSFGRYLNLSDSKIRSFLINFNPNMILTLENTTKEECQMACARIPALMFEMKYDHPEWF